MTIRGNARSTVAVVLAFGVWIGLSISYHGLGYTPYLDPMLAQPGLPAAKRVLLQQEQDAINAARQHPGPKVSVGPPPVGSLAPYPNGIADLHDGPFSACEFTVNDIWFGPGGTLGRLAVYAGGKRLHPCVDPSSAAAVRVYTMNPNPYKPLEFTEVGIFIAPGTSGSITIIAARGAVLKLRTDDGRTLTFDTRTYRFG